MKHSLIELEAKFLSYEKEDDRVLYHYVDDITKAQGVIFLCPLCFDKNNGPIGTHSVICWSRSRGVPDDAHPKPGRWTLQGTGLYDLTLDGDPIGNARSVLLTSGCGWHGFVTNGEAE